MEAKVGQVLDLYGLGIDFGSYFGALWEQKRLKLASKIDAKINAERIMKMNAKMHENILKPMEKLWKFIENSMNNQ